MSLAVVAGAAMADSVVVMVMVIEGEPEGIDEGGMMIEETGAEEM